MKIMWHPTLTKESNTARNMFFPVPNMLKDRAVPIKVLSQLCKGLMQFVEYFWLEGHLTHFSDCFNRIK